MGERLIEQLERRGLIAQVSDRQGLTEHLQSGSRTIYCGFDPTADSLHIGNLVPLVMLKRFQLAGHRPILLLGGATGLIGDPSGRVDERSLNSADLVAQWVKQIRGQAEGFVDFSGTNGAVIVNNLEWTADLNVITFLRDVGKHFSVNAMVQRESVRSRLDRDGEGISYTEFSYMLLQAMDYAELAERYDCTVQIGGSDQWGNIVSGMDLVRRRSKKAAFALTLPLVTKADDTKFGKTADGAVWLDPERTTPYGFYQFWLNTADSDVVYFLRIFTFVALEDIDALAKMTQQTPARREAQQRLADEITAMVHGGAALASARRISQCLFEGDVQGLTEADLMQLQQDGIDCTVPSSTGLLAALAESGLAPSRGAARKLVASGGVSVNGVVEKDPERQLDWASALYGRFHVVRRGKKRWHLLVRPDRAVSNVDGAPPTPIGFAFNLGASAVCGAPTRSGKPCRKRSSSSGRCHLHRA